MKASGALRHQATHDNMLAWTYGGQGTVLLLDWVLAKGLYGRVEHLIEI
jgi:hypothetical protein